MPSWLDDDNYVEEDDGDDDDDDNNNNNNNCRIYPPNGILYLILQLIPVITTSVTATPRL
jgi:hypothetical protein